MTTNTTQTNATDLSPELAARLERLGARRAQTAPTPTGPAADLDAATAARLERLAARNPRTAASPPPSGSSKPKRRNHAAQGSRIAALALSLATTSGLTTFFALEDSAPSGGIAAGGSEQIVAGGVTTTVLPQSTAAATTTPTPQSTVPATTTPQVSVTAPTTTSAPVAAAIVTGDVFRNRWGNVQVEATFAADGTLTDVTVLQAPSGDRRSVQINNIAVPYLNGEALTAQSANVDTISGATYTSVGYEQSLQSAIDAARAQGITQLA
jgi:uncharacterized protein with FMN-binding domain